MATTTTTTTEDGNLPDGWSHATDGVTGMKYLAISKEPNVQPTEIFLLRQGAFYDVQMYVLTGMMFPKNNEDFAQIVPEKQVESLTKHDPSAWSDIRLALVDIHNHCDTFNTDGMSTWTLLTNGIVAYADYCVRNMKGPDNLTANLEVICGPKYTPTSGRPEPAHDSDYEDAVAVCQSICDDLKNQADSYAGSIKTQIQKVEGFKNQTMVDKQKVDAIDWKFTSRKNKDGTDRKPWGELISDDIARVKNQEAANVKKAKDAWAEYDYDVVVAATSPTYAWIFPFGTIAAAGVETGYTIKALEAKRKAEQAERDYADEVKAELALTKLSNWVSHLGTTFHNLDKAMDDAIKSLAAIQDMFNQQSKSFALISADLGDAEGAFNKRWAVRKRALNKFSECYKEWQQIMELADEFLATKKVTLTGQEAAKSVGNLEPLSGAVPPGDK